MTQKEEWNIFRSGNRYSDWQIFCECHKRKVPDRSTRDTLLKIKACLRFQTAQSRSWNLQGKTICSPLPWNSGWNMRMPEPVPPMTTAGKKRRKRFWLLKILSPMQLVSIKKWLEQCRNTLFSQTETLYVDYFPPSAGTHIKWTFELRRKDNMNFEHSTSNVQLPMGIWESDKESRSRDLVGVFTMSDDVARSRAPAAPGSMTLRVLIEIWISFGYWTFRVGFSLFAKGDE